MWKGLAVLVSVGKGDEEAVSVFVNFLVILGDPVKGIRDIGGIWNRLPPNPHIPPYFPTHF